MAILWVEGFEQYTGDVDVDRAYVDRPASGITITTGGRNTELTNNRALYLSYNANWLIKKVPASTATVVLGFAFKNDASYDLYLPVVELRSTETNPHVSIKVNTDGKWHITGPAGGSLCNSGDWTLSANVWHYVELVVTLHNTTGSVELFIDGDSKCSATAVDTLYGSTAEVHYVKIANYGGIGDSAYFDDIYLLDDSGTDNTSRLGNVIIETQFPNANGTTNDFTASPAVTNYQNVDEGADPDDATTFNYSSTATDKELYGFPDLESTIINEIKAVGVTNYSRKGGAGYRTIRGLARSVATESEGATVPMTTDWYYQSEIFENDPNGGINWTESAVNAAEFGLKIQD